MTDKVEDEMLMAYVDGGLTDEQTATVERVLKTDAAARQFVAELQRVSELSRQAYNKPISEPVPQRLIDTILAGADVARTTGTKTSAADEHDGTRKEATSDNVLAFKRRWIPSLSSGSFSMPAATAMAAALTLAVGIGIGMSLIARPSLKSQIAVGPVAPGSQLATQLQSLASGTPDNLTPNEQVLIVGTFKDRGGRLCREFEVLTVLDDSPVPQSAAVACRSGQEGWRIEGAFRLAQPATEASPSGYVPSGAQEKDALSSLMSILGAQPLLSPKEEAELIAKRWKIE